MYFNTGLPSEVLGTVEAMLTEDYDPKGQRSGSDTGDQDLSVAGGDGSLVEEEARETGVVKFGIYKSYWTAVGKCLATSVLIALFFMQGWFPLEFMLLY